MSRAASVCNDWGEVDITLKCRDEYKWLCFRRITPDKVSYQINLFISIHYTSVRNKSTIITNNSRAIARESLLEGCHKLYIH